MHFYASGVILLSWAIWLWETYLDYRQYHVIRTTDRVPDILKEKINEETFKKSKCYSLDKARFGFISSIYSQLQMTLTIYFFLMAYFWDLSEHVMTEYFGLSKSDTVEWEIFKSIVFTFISSVESTLVSLPISIYSTFVLEQRHGFNKQTAGFYTWDKIKQFLVSFTITAPVVSGLVYIVRKGGDNFFIYLWLFCFVVTMILVLFHGEIAALFDKFSPLPECELKNMINSLAEEVRFPLSGIYIVEGSRRSTHSNAYQSGLFNKKHIVIYDTLIADYHKKNEAMGETTSKQDDEADGVHSKVQTKGCNNEEIIAVLCHEIGHWWHMHLFKNLILTQINFFFIFLIFSRLYKSPTLYEAFGFRDQPVVIGFTVLMMLLTPYFEIQGFFTTLLSRKFEYQADLFAAKRGHAEKLKTALVKLNNDNLSFPVCDELYSTFNHSHPTLIQRIKALEHVKSD